ncbi:MAG: hypothetical protein LUF04_03305, partial [Bacteroides sp.]|nr:hypothetical protein [Bacteroides sp.]
ITCPLINVFADLSVLSGIERYKDLYQEETNVNRRLRGLNKEMEVLHTSVMVSENDAAPTVVLDGVVTGKASYNFWESADNAKKVAKYAMKQGWTKADFMENRGRIKYTIKQLFSNTKVYTKRIEALRRILSATRYSLEGKEWI